MKSSSPFPVYDQQVVTGNLLPGRGLKFIDFDDALNLYMETVNSKETSADDFGPIILPYEEVWFEGIDREFDGGRLNVSVHATQAKDEDGYILQFSATAMAPNRAITELPAMLILSVDSAGKIRSLNRAIAADDADALGDDLMQHTDQLSKYYCGAAMFAIGLMNCRNVKSPIKTHTPKTRRSSRPKPAIEYHVINVPGYSASGIGSGALTGTTKMHTARGHFKTYTEDAPLMGKHVGTYYWGWQVRGRKENGEVISSYKVGA